ncbi:hypothetical protein Scep_012147 [Stephania cephalantha]|uniref:DUF4371 domain-containing protein n=1 Tax=Stephania cephalantha TaxID=152367 RepID=A0AAP0JEN3_9MAGN
MHKLRDVRKNRLRLKVTSEVFDGLVYKDAQLEVIVKVQLRKNRGNLIEMLKLMGRLNVNIEDVILDNAPGNAKYTSPNIQKEILHIMANMVRKKIREEIGDKKFCLLVDEAKDAGGKEEMAIVLRFVDGQGSIKERFFDIVQVENTAASTLKKSVCNSLARYNLLIDDLRGQGYDGASNMRGAWNGLQALFLKDCPYAYYVHCFAHRLQLALVALLKRNRRFGYSFQSCLLLLTL